MKKKSGFFIKPFVAMLALIALAGLLFASCGSGAGSGTRTIKYEVTGSPSTTAVIVYYNESGSPITLPNETIPWSKTVDLQSGVVAIGFGWTITSSSGTYTGKIYVNGKEEKSATTNIGNLTVTF